MPAAPAIGHVVREYLPRSATFIHTALRFQRRARPVVLAGRTEHLDEFPFEPVVALVEPGAPVAARALRRARARLAGWPDALQHGIAVEARRHRCALLHAHFGPTGCMVLEARRRSGLPLVTTFYGYDLGLPGHDPAWRDPYKRLFAEGERFVCEGPAMAERLVEIGAPADRVRVVKIGLDLEQFPFAPRPRGAPLVVMQTARFIEKKGLDLSIAAFAAARERLGPSELWLIGDGPLRADLEELAAELGAADAVRFHGMVSHGEYRDLLARTDIGIHPSRTARDGDTEGGAPTVLLELQAAGIPVVATRHADIPQVIPYPDELAPENDVEALAEALVRVASLDDAAWLERAGAGRALVEREHDAAITAARLEDVYFELLG